MKMLIFSLDTKDKKTPKSEYETMKEHMKTSKMLITDAKGIYKGTPEDALICLLNEEIQDQMVMAIAHAYKQESVLEVEVPSKKSYLRFIDGSPKQYVGIWREVEPGTKITDDFIINMENMKIYKCFPETVDKTV